MTFRIIIHSSRNMSITLKIYTNTQSDGQSGHWCVISVVVRMAVTPYTTVTCLQAINKEKTFSPHIGSLFKSEPVKSIPVTVNIAGIHTWPHLNSIPCTPHITGVTASPEIAVVNTSSTWDATKKANAPEHHPKKPLFLSHGEKPTRIKSQKTGFQSKLKRK